MKKINQNALILSSNGIVCQSCVKQACLRDSANIRLSGSHSLFSSIVLYLDERFLIFFTFSVFCVVHVLVIH